MQIGTLPTALDQKSPSEKRKVCLEILSKSDYPYQLLQTQIQPQRQRPGFKGYKIVVGKNVNNIKHPLQPEVPLAENCKALKKKTIEISSLAEKEVISFIFVSSMPQRWNRMKS